MRSLAIGGYTVAEVTDADMHRVADLIRTSSDLPLGAADASVIALAERMGIAEIATLDRRHFTVVCPRRVAAFTFLPK